jgi:hypothetical protein
MRLLGGNQHERALFGAEEVANGLDVALDGHGQLIPGSVLRDRDDVVAHPVMPHRIALLQRTLGISKLSRPVGETDDQRWHTAHDICRRQASGTPPGSAQVTTCSLTSETTPDLV